REISSRQYRHRPGAGQPLRPSRPGAEPGAIARAAAALGVRMQGAAMEDLLAEVLAEAGPHRASGRVADYIPALAKVDPNKLGIAYADKDGRVRGAGDCDETFSIQS